MPGIMLRFIGAAGIVREVHTSSLDNREPYTAYKVWFFTSQAMHDSRHVATGASTASIGWFYARLGLWLCLTFLLLLSRTMFSWGANSACRPLCNL